MIKRRSGTILAPADASTMSEANLIKKIATDDYILISANIPSRTWGNYDLRVFLLSPNSAYASDLAQIRKIIALVSGYKQNTDVMIVSYDGLSTHISNFLLTFRSDFVRLLCFTYALFGEIIPECDAVAKHVILEKEEVAELETRCINRESMRRIKYYDPPVAWLGARPGDVIMILQPSMSGIIPEYYICVS